MALLHALYARAESETQLAMPAGIEVNARDARGHTALLRAMKLGRMPAITAPLDAQAEPVDFWT